jgi:hypothetical protein
MTRIYRYILAHDEGMAPCPAGGTISLATCKPAIRCKAAPGDWVLGFRAGSLHRGLLLWAGRVEQAMSHGEYQRAHLLRPDAVYRERSDGQYERLRPDYHPTQKEMERDTSAPVLLFDPAVSLYLEGQPVPLPPELEHLAAAGRGHRVNGTRSGDVAALEAWLATLARPAPRPSGRGASADGCGPRTKRGEGEQRRRSSKRGC